MHNPKIYWLATFIATASILITSCAPSAGPQPVLAAFNGFTPTPAGPAWPVSQRPEYAPGELVDYVAQAGDTISGLAGHFNTTIDEIRNANPNIPSDATTMPPGMPMKIPIYYLPLWGSTFQIIPDSAFVLGPDLIGFNTAAFIATQPGWLKNYKTYAGGDNRNGGQLIDYVAGNFSVSPRLLLAILEYQTGALSQPEMPDDPYLLGYEEPLHKGLYLQLVWAANILNNGYYGWRDGTLTQIELPDNTLTRPDPWQNAATVGIQYYFSRIYSSQDFAKVTSESGLAATYRNLFGDPWTISDPTTFIPGSLRQPTLHLPFQPGQTWTLTGGPHTGFGDGQPLAALDFAPPSEHSGCFVPESRNYAAAIASGPVVRSDIGLVVQDLDGDGDERTGWVIVYFHIATPGKARVGQMLQTGDKVGSPSCEGGRTTGTHVHIARKYNGEWVLADGPLAFNLEGWVAHNGSRAYLGGLTRGSAMIEACDCSDAYSQITSDQPFQ
jgi:LasA protease